MAGDIVRAVAKVQALAGALDGMRAAPEEPPEQMSVFPFAVSYISGVEISKHPGWFAYLFTIRTEIHIARKDLPRDVRKINPYATSFPAAIWADVQLSDSDGITVETVNTLTGSLVASEWGGVETLAWQFDTQVKVI